MPAGAAEHQGGGSVLAIWNTKASFSGPCTVFLLSALTRDQDCPEAEYLGNQSTKQPPSGLISWRLTGMRSATKY